MADFNTIEEMLVFQARKHFNDAHVTTQTYGFQITVVTDPKEALDLTKLKSKALAYDIIERGMTARVDKPGEIHVFVP